jgi:hypothetical protein
MSNFYIGIVEDISDPELRGRCKIRMVRLHTDNREDDSQENYMPIEDLPWATPAFPITSPNISGMSDFGLPALGSTVICFFMDDEKQRPFYFATVPSIPAAAPDYSKGFSDPDGVNPATVGESQISKHAQGLETDIVTAKKGSLQGPEPATPYAPVYPKNRVIETESHVIELDDTPGAERVHIYHKSGTFTEVHPDGKRVKKVVNTDYEIIVGDKELDVKGDLNINVAGDSNVTVTGDVNIIATGNAKIEAARIDLN